VGVRSRRRHLRRLARAIVVEHRRVTVKLPVRLERVRPSAAWFAAPRRLHAGGPSLKSQRMLSVSCFSW